MLNFIWPIFIILSFSYAIFSGNLQNLNSSIFESVESAVNLSITMLGTMCLWSGIIHVATNTKIINIIHKLLKPVIKFLFPEIKHNTKAQNEISMNMVANILGLGNAATPLGLKAMETLQEENEHKETLSNSMIMLIVLNTDSIQIIPTTIIAIRSSLGSENPTAIIVPVWIATICAGIAGISITKLLIKYSKKRKNI